MLFRRTLVALCPLLTTAFVLAGSPAVAAKPGDGRAVAVELGLNASPVLIANAVIGEVGAPDAVGINRLPAVDLAAGLGPSVQVAIDGSADVSSQRAPTRTNSSAAVRNLALSLFGVPVVTATEISASVHCADSGSGSGSLDYAGLRLFGSVVFPDSNDAGITDSRPVPLVARGVANPVLVTNVVQASGPGNQPTTFNIGLVITLRLQAFVFGQPMDVLLGQVHVARVECWDLTLPPTASSVLPLLGPTAGGQLVSITGTNFVPDRTSVTFGGLPATVVSVNPTGTQLQVLTPPHPVSGTVDVVVSTDLGGATTPMRYDYEPGGHDAVVHLLTPVGGPTTGGTPLTITGHDLGGAVGVLVGGVVGSDFVGGANQITVTTPSSDSAGAASVLIRYPGGTVPAGTFTYLGPTVTSISPPTGPSAGGTIVIANGAGLGHAQRVLVGGIPASEVNSNVDGTQLRFTTPPHATGVVGFVVELPGLDISIPNTFGYLPAEPLPTSVPPNQGPPTLPVTGGSVGPVVISGLTMVAIGGVLVLLAYRRTRAEEGAVLNAFDQASRNC